MSQLLISGALTYLPMSTFATNGTGAAVTLNAAGETCVFAGYVVLENPLSSSKTISAAGSGKIVWNAGAVTFASGSTTFEVGIQDVSTAASPTQGDGTFDVKATFTGGGGGITGSATNTSIMTSGTKTIANGDLVAIVFTMPARGGTDSVVVNNTASAVPGITTVGGFPVVTDNTAGSYAKTATSVPLAYIVFDDGTLGWFYGAPFYTNITSLAYNSTTGTADEYGNVINYPFQFVALGIRATVNFSGTSADGELLLYSDPLGTPSVLKTITLDATQSSATASALNIFGLFANPYVLPAKTPFGITLRPTTANNITMYYRSVASVTEGKTADIGTYNYAIRRLDNTGAFSDYNGGTAKTRQISIGLVGSHVEQGVNICSGQVGVF